jgi:SOUL heme-binding protein
VAEGPAPVKFLWPCPQRGLSTCLQDYIFGKANSSGEKMAMTTPVFTSSAGAMQFVVGKAGKVGVLLMRGDDTAVLRRTVHPLHHTVVQSVTSLYLLHLRARSSFLRRQTTASQSSSSPAGTTPASPSAAQQTRGRWLQGSVAQRKRRCAFRIRSDTRPSLLLRLTSHPCHLQVQQQLQRLRQAARKHDLKLKSPSDYIVARYNDPGTKPIFRRNEVLVELEDFKLW